MALSRRFRYEILEAPEQAIPAGSVAGGEVFPRRLVGDDGALVAALKREKVTGRMRGKPAGGERPRYI
jgi:hypothetical protein